MIAVQRWDRKSDDWVVAQLERGLAVSCYWLNWRTLKQYTLDRLPMADVWYSERNGDPIALWVPKDTPESELPDWAQDYNIFEWIDPDKEFGTGYKPSLSAA